MRRRFVTTLLVLVAACLALASRPTAAWAQGGERISRYDIDIAVAADGSAVFRETIVFDFGTDVRHGIDRIIPTIVRFDDEHDRRYPLDVVTVTSPDAPAQYQVGDVGNGRTRVRIGDPARTITGSHTYVLTYRLGGVVNAQTGDDELYWNAVGDEWTVPIDAAIVRVTVPGGAARVACFAGPTRSTAPCASATIVPGTAGVVATASFAHRGLAAGQGMSVVVAIPDADGDAREPAPILVARTLHEPRTFGDMFAATPGTLGVAGVITALFAAVIARLQFLVGRDRVVPGAATDAAFSTQVGEGAPVPLRDHTAIPVEFVPPDSLRPAQLGLLLDEVAHTRDVSATIVDLAVRGHLRIEELTANDKIIDYRFVELRIGDHDGLLEYERHLLAKIFEKGSEVQLSSLKNKFATSMAETKKLLYDNAMANGWFSARPDRVRTRWALFGLVITAVGVALTVLLASRSHWGLAGVPVAGAGLVTMIGAKWMPRRTPKGTGLARRGRGFEDFIRNSEQHRAAFAERANLFTEYLPYAVALGAVDRWANTLAALGMQPPDTSAWYVGRGPVVWTSFGDRMDTFASRTASTLTSTPGNSGSSGFSSGGGFSGGGGGGGGGGSW